jgi:leucyl aminopeptidase (aminopeptidase T)
MSELQEAARVALKDCLGLAPGERALIVTDPLRMEVAGALFAAVEGLGGVPMLVEIPVGERDGDEPPDAVAALMADTEVLLAPTSRSLSHTAARRNASRAGVRTATLPGITTEIMGRAMRADYDAIARLSTDLARILTDAARVRVTTPAGTDIEMSIEGRTGLADTGLIRERGDFSNLPAGEAYLAPVEGTAEGVIVVDASMAGVGRLAAGETITLVVEGGRAREVRGSGAETIRGLIESVGEEGGNIAELGIGTNDRAEVSGVVLEDEKVLGTVHLAVGNNLSMGGHVDVPLHLDGVLFDPTVEVDGVTILKDGKIRLA